MPCSFNHCGLFTLPNCLNFVKFELLYAIPIGIDNGSLCYLYYSSCFGSLLGFMKDRFAYQFLYSKSCQ